jgi:hypothetical protein
MQRVIILLLLTFSILLDCGFPQEVPRAEDKPIIESVDVTGVPENRITGELRDAMQALVGQRFDQLAADEVGFRIQTAVSQRISAIRQLPGNMPDQVKLLFEFGNLPPQAESEADSNRERNVNSRYTVEAVELVGVPESSISNSLHADMNRLIGQKLDEDRADQIERRMRRELRPKYTVSRKVQRGSDRDHVRLVFEAEKAPLFDFYKFGDYFVGQSKQSVSYGLGLDIDFHHNRITVGALDDGDALIERDEGYWLGFENIKTGTEHLGFRIDYYDYNLKWKQETRNALALAPEISGIYRERRGIEPSLTVAFDRRFRVVAGFNVTSLQMQDPLIHDQNANALAAGATFHNLWGDRGSVRQDVTIDYSVHTASHNLDSDFIYTRHFAQAQYTVTSRRNQFVAIGEGGILTGQAPLFERFSLGNTTTLRGWNKYDLDPIGGNRLAYGSLEYRYTVLQVYYDFGSVWQQPNPYHVSHAIGFGLHSRARENKRDKWFMTFGIPIQSGHVEVSNLLFMAGVRF